MGLRIRRLGVQVPPGIIFWGISSIGRVRALQARGTGIETLMLHFFFSEKYKKTKHLNTNSHIVPHFGLASIAWMAERSKALDSSSSIFGCVGSNPTPSIVCRLGKIKTNVLISHSSVCGPLV